MSDKGLIPPHGGKLVNLVVDATRRRTLEEAARKLPRIKLPEREQCDLELLAVGAMSPLTTFMGQADFNGVCDRMRLASGLVWSMPVTCSTDKATAGHIESGQQLVLTDDHDRMPMINRHAGHNGRVIRKAAVSVYL